MKENFKKTIIKYRQNLAKLKKIMTFSSEFKYRVLLVDPEIETRNILEKILKTEGVEYKVESSTAIGLKRALKEHYDLIISEIRANQSEISGLNLLERIRENNQGIPFIAISDITSVENSIKAINYGVSGYLLKPLNPSEAQETIKRAIRYHEGRFLKNELDNYRMENIFNAVINSEEKSILKLLDTVDNLIELVYPKEYGSLPDLKMAIYEGLSNAMEHGNKAQAGRNIFFKLQLKMDKIMVHIKDEGEGFDALSAIEQSSDRHDVNANITSGLRLILHLMDEVSYNMKGNEINLLKILR